MCLFVRLVVLWILAVCVQGASAAPAEPDALDVQLRLFEAIAKAGQPAADQNKQVLEAVQKVAAETIAVAKASAEGAKESNQHVFILVAGVGGVLTAVVAILVFLGIRELRDLKAMRLNAKKQIDDLIVDLKRDVEEARGVKKALTEEIVKVRGDAARDNHALGAMSFNMSTFNSDKDAVISDPGVLRDKPWRFQELTARLTIIERDAVALSDQRVLRWIEGERALLHYFKDDFLTAWKHQKLACAAVGRDDHAFVDRYRNLACIASKVFETHGDRLALREADEALTRLEASMEPWQASELLEDADLNAVFNALPAHRSALQALVDIQPPAP